MQSRSVLVLGLLLCVIFNVHFCVPQDQIDALHDFYSATNIPSKGWGSTWNFDFPPVDPCHFYGIYCDSDSSIIVRIHLDTEFLTGTLPASLAALTDLQEFSLNLNSLSGTLPPELSMMNALTSFSFAFNSFTGSLPPEWSSFPSLERLEAGYNQLSGTLPAEWESLPNIQDLRLAGNHFDGTIPSRWKALSQLQTLDISENQLTGTLPPEFNMLTTLTRLSASTNQLSGTLPPEWGSLDLISSFSLSWNSFTGSIPQSWANLASLTDFDVHQNQLTGPLPDYSRPLDYMFLNNNNFCGDLPSTPPAGYFDLSENHWHCPLPSWCSGACGECETSLESQCIFNDDCPEATTIVSGIPITSSNQGATSDAARISSNCPGTDGTNQDNGLWFTFDSETYDYVSLSVCGAASFDTSLQLFTGLCSDNSLVCVGANDNGICGSQSEIAQSIIPSTTYYILLSGSSSEDSGSFTLTMVLSQTAPVNDDCLNALPITSGVPVSGSTVGGTSDESRIALNCGAVIGIQPNGVWYTFDSETNDQVSLSLCGGASFDTILILFTGSCSGSTLSCLASNDNSCGSQSSLYNTAIPTGTTFYVLVSGITPADTGAFTLTMNLATTSGAGGDPHVKDSAGNLFDIPKEFGNTIMALYHSDKLHINAFINETSMMITKIGASFINPRGDTLQVFHLESIVENDFPAFYLNGELISMNSDSLPDWIQISPPRHVFGNGILSELGRYHEIELEVESLFIIVGGYHPVSEGFFNVQVFHQEEFFHENHGLLQSDHARAPTDFSSFIRQSLFDVNH